ncbi:MAG: type II 3-dehydroquinate dehydratase [Candidatus Marinamargulisbacteria bacterium]
MKYCVIHGPNLNLLGRRDPEHYGHLTLDVINQHIHQLAQEKGVDCTIIQSNAESDIINALQQHGGAKGIVLNPAGYTHTSVAIRDAVDAIDAPVIEVHLSNVYKREAFRHVSYTAPVCVGQISGLGWQGYIMALDYLISLS